MIAKRPMIWPAWLESAISLSKMKATMGTYDKSRECSHRGKDNVINIILCDSPWFLCTTCLEQGLQGALKPETCVRCLMRSSSHITKIGAETSTGDLMRFWFGICDDCFASSLIEFENVKVDQ